MIGPGYTSPPSIALLAYAAAQAGLVMAAESPGCWPGPAAGAAASSG
jgi:hypothetical protein